MDINSIHVFVIACSIINYILLKMLTYKTHTTLKLRYIILMPIALYTVHYYYNSNTNVISDEISKTVSEISSSAKSHVPSVLGSEFKI